MEHLNKVRLAGILLCVPDPERIEAPFDPSAARIPKNLLTDR